jgi:hypothetical protein
MMLEEEEEEEYEVYKNVPIINESPLQASQHHKHALLLRSSEHENTISARVQHVVQTRAFAVQHKQNHATRATSTMLHVLHDDPASEHQNTICPRKFYGQTDIL